MVVQPEAPGRHETVLDIQTTQKKCATCPVVLELENGTEWKTQCADCFKDDRTKRPCKICTKKRICITEPSYKDVCGTCYKEAPMKPCNTCKQYVLKAFDWRNMCGDCFRVGDFKRPCQECKIRPIAEHLPSYITSCSRCYLNKKKKTHDACPWCVPEVKKAVTLNKRKEAPGCRKCMESRGMLQLFGENLSRLFDGNGNPLVKEEDSEMGLPPLTMLPPPVPLSRQMTGWCGTEPPVVSLIGDVPSVPTWGGVIPA